MFTEKTVKELVQILGAKLTTLGLVATTAESCTGGGVAYAITEISGSSQWFDRSFVTYSNAAKVDMLGVSGDLIKEFGAVSEEVAYAMAMGALDKANADVSVAISGVAGPTGGTPEKPVGTVCIAWCSINHACKKTTYLLTGDRSEVREKSILLALQGLIDTMDTHF